MRVCVCAYVCVFDQLKATTDKTLADMTEVATRFSRLNCLAKAMSQVSKERCKLFKTALLYSRRDLVRAPVSGVHTNRAL